jgi:chemotaxis protein MotB
MREFISFQHENEPNEAAGNHRWMISYADFMTLLFVLFLVLYAKLPKHVELQGPQVQNAHVLHVLPIADIRPQPVTLIAPRKSRILSTAPVIDMSVIDRQQMLVRELARTFTDLLQDGEVTVETRAEGVLLDIKDSALFASGTAQPAPQANEIVSQIALILAKNDNRIVVEGHTDSVPIHTAQFPSNWELSSARAAAIVRALQEQGINANRMTASGLAETRPKSSNETTQGRSENRRVSLLVLND